jgi:hypothetical protein
VLCCSGSSERAVPIAATPAARAAFFAVRLSFGRRVFFDAAPLALVVFGLERARFDVDLAFARLTLFMPQGAIHPIIRSPRRRGRAASVKNVEAWGIEYSPYIYARTPEPWRARNIFGDVRKLCRSTMGSSILFTRHTCATCRKRISTLRSRNCSVSAPLSTSTEFSQGQPTCPGRRE